MKPWARGRRREEGDDPQGVSQRLEVIKGPDGEARGRWSQHHRRRYRVLTSPDIDFHESLDRKVALKKCYWSLFLAALLHHEGRSWWRLGFVSLGLRPSWKALRRGCRTGPRRFCPFGRQDFVCLAVELIRGDCVRCKASSWQSCCTKKS